MTEPIGARRLQSAQEFAAQPWTEIASWFRELVEVNEVFRPMLAVAESVIDEGAETQLSVDRSMQDLIVMTAPPEPGPWREGDYVRIGLDRTRSGHLTGRGVAIEHHPETGAGDRTVGPATDVLPIFWRFMSQKYAVHPEPGSS